MKFATAGCSPTERKRPARRNIRAQRMTARVAAECPRCARKRVRLRCARGHDPDRAPATARFAPQPGAEHRPDGLPAASRTSGGWPSSARLDGPILERGADRGVHPPPTAISSDSRSAPSRRPCIRPRSDAVATFPEAKANGPGSSGACGGNLGTWPVDFLQRRIIHGLSRGSHQQANIDAPEAATPAAYGQKETRGLGEEHHAEARHQEIEACGSNG